MPRVGRAEEEEEKEEKEEGEEGELAASRGSKKRGGPVEGLTQQVRRRVWTSPPPPKLQGRDVQARRTKLLPVVVVSQEAASYPAARPT